MLPTCGRAAGDQDKHVVAADLDRTRSHASCDLAHGRCQRHEGVLEDLVAVRPRQVLERIDPITVPTADGPRVLVGWRQRGTGIVPVHYWTTETGWPLLVCGQRRVLIATALSASATPTGS